MRKIEDMFLVTSRPAKFGLLPDDMESYDYQAREIFHSLANVNRYNGHQINISKPISVLAHSVAVMELLGIWGESLEDRMYGLFHDASEAYINDIVRPVKHSGIMETYLQMEYFIQSRIYRKILGDTPGIESKRRVELADYTVLSLEIGSFLPDGFNQALWPNIASKKMVREYGDSLLKFYDWDQVALFNHAEKAYLEYDEAVQEARAMKLDKDQYSYR